MKELSLDNNFTVHVPPPSKRFVAKKKTLHFLIPVGGCIIDRHPASCTLPPSPFQTSTWLPPCWLKAPSVQLGVSWSAKFRPRIKCKTTRRIPDDAECFEAAKAGDISRFKALMASGECGVGEIALSTEYTMLLWAVIKRQARMVDFLVDKGADPLHHFLGIQPAPCHLAWDLWLRGLKRRDHMLIMKSMLKKGAITWITWISPSFIESS